MDLDLLVSFFSRNRRAKISNTENEQDYLSHKQHVLVTPNYSYPSTSGGTINELTSHRDKGQLYKETIHITQTKVAD